MTSPRLIFIELYLSNNDVPSLPHHQKSHTQPNLTDMLATLTKNGIERDLLVSVITHTTIIAHEHKPLNPVAYTGNLVRQHAVVKISCCQANYFDEIPACHTCMFLLHNQLVIQNAVDYHYSGNWSWNSVFFSQRVTVRFWSIVELNECQGYVARSARDRIYPSLSPEVRFSLMECCHCYFLVYVVGYFLLLDL